MNWKDCPMCGSKNSMEFISNFTETYGKGSEHPIVVEGLELYQCKVCKDGFFTEESEKKISAVFKQIKSGKK